MQFFSETSTKSDRNSTTEKSAIYIYSKGMPREACILADNSLLAAFLSDKKRVGKETVDAAYKDRVSNIGEDKSPTDAKSMKNTKKK
jgi:hypothetical protein